MFISYNPKDKHLKYIPYSTPGSSEPTTTGAVQLRPGTNEINEEEWKAIQPHIQAELKSGIIKAYTIPVKNKNGGVKKAKTLKDAPLSTAVKIINGCENKATLKKWFNDPLPDEILLVVSKRLRALKIDPDDVAEGVERAALTDEEIVDESGGDTPEEETAGEETPESEGKGKRTGKGREKGGKPATDKDVNIPAETATGETSEEDIPDFDDPEAMKNG